MNTPDLYAEIAAAQAERRPCALATVVSAVGSLPCQPGDKLLVYGDGAASGTVGGGRFEASVVSEALEIIREGEPPQLKTYRLREGEPLTAGAECGGEAGVFIEGLLNGDAVWIVGGGRCSEAIAELAARCGWFAGVVEDRADHLRRAAYPAAARLVTDQSAPEFIAGRAWTAREALVIVTRDAERDQAALAAALARPVPGYIGMMGSQRKVARVFDALAAAGHAREDLARVHAPIGLDIGAESPAEIAVSVVAEVLGFVRKGVGKGEWRAG